MKDRIITWLKKPSGEISNNGCELSNWEVVLSDAIAAIIVGVATGTIFGYFYMRMKGLG